VMISSVANTGLDKLKDALWRKLHLTPSPKASVER
jgi:hypothetical protein